jgi:FAD:protein FMN transferase
MKAKSRMKYAVQAYTLIMLIAAVTIAVTTANANPAIQKISRSVESMDTFFTITVYSDEPEPAETAIAEAFNEIKKIESELSVYRGDSEISKLNRDKIIKSPFEDLKINIEKALYYSNLSDGAFDITIQPILDLYNRSFIEKGSIPSAKTINRELKKIGYKRIIIKDREIRIGDNQRITLGGIAKGYAVEKAVEILKRHHITMALVDAGGNMRALGKKPEGMWTVALADPRDANNYITTIALDNNAVSTSGDYERYFDDEMKYHHIINPKTGYSATELISVTIVTDNAFDADALSTAVFVLGKEKGMRLIESLPGVESLIITREKEIVKSSGFKEDINNDYFAAPSESLAPMISP